LTWRRAAALFRNHVRGVPPRRARCSGATPRLVEHGRTGPSVLAIANPDSTTKTQAANATFLMTA
jgi:hypothetical protein